MITPTIAIVSVALMAQTAVLNEDSTVCVGAAVCISLTGKADTADVQP
jgi:hypothetical protein